MASDAVEVKGSVDVLVCTCGDCSHWEIVEKKAKGVTEQYLKCISCDHVFPITGLEVPEHDKLEWVKRKKI